jgi:hypothetical protein
VDTNQKYFQAVFDEVSQELTAPSRIKTFTHNPDVIGAHAEAVVRRLFKCVLAPYRISTGSIISPEQFENKMLPQIDVIIWTPAPIPALFEAGDFALVPRRGVAGISEIKRSCYSGVGKKIESVLNKAPELTSDFKTLQPLALGVVIVRESTQSDNALDDLISRNLSVVLIDQIGDEYKPNSKGISGLINFLAAVRNRALILDHAGICLA